MTAVTVLGTINVDTILRVRDHPIPGETVLGYERSVRPGGKGANQATAVAATGTDVQLIGAIGADQLGREYVERLTHQGVDTTGIQQVPDAPTGRAFITVTAEGENSIIVFPGANSAVEEDAVITAIRPETRWLLAQLELPVGLVRAAFEFARQHGVTTVLNASPISESMAEVLDLADILIVNEIESRHIPMGRDVCVTLGSRGAAWGNHTAAPDPVNVVDTTGAGDAFAGTLVGRLAQGADREQALEDAVRVGAQTTTFEGAQQWDFSS